MFHNRDMVRYYLYTLNKWHSINEIPFKTENIENEQYKKIKKKSKV